MILPSLAMDSQSDTQPWQFVAIITRGFEAPPVEEIIKY